MKLNIIKHTFSPGQEDICHRLNLSFFLGCARWFLKLPAKFDDRTLIWKLMHPL